MLDSASGPDAPRLLLTISVGRPLSLGRPAAAATIIQLITGSAEATPNARLVRITELAKRCAMVIFFGAMGGAATEASPRSYDGASVAPAAGAAPREISRYLSSSRMLRGSLSAPREGR
jgi:hypothetical protein